MNLKWDTAVKNEYSGIIYIMHIHISIYQLNYMHNIQIYENNNNNNKLINKWYIIITFNEKNSSVNLCVCCIYIFI
jgi:hypothetical protein